MKMVVYTILCCICLPLFSAEEWRHLSFLGYSNLTDPVFRKVYEVDFYSNRWDNVLGTRVNCGCVKKMTSKEDHSLCEFRDWVEKDRLIVDWTEIMITVVPTGGCSDVSVERDRNTIKPMFDFCTSINQMDGYSVVDSSPSISYRGDSARRCHSIITEWLEKVNDNPSISSEGIGFQWEVRKDCYCIKYLSFNQEKGLVLAMTKYAQHKITNFPPFKKKEN